VLNKITFPTMGILFFSVFTWFTNSMFLGQNIIDSLKVICVGLVVYIIVLICINLFRLGVYNGFFNYIKYYKELKLLNDFNLTNYRLENLLLKSIIQYVILIFLITNINPYSISITELCFLNILGLFMLMVTSFLKV
jgi:hypothetical protein